MSISSALPFLSHQRMVQIFETIKNTIENFGFPKQMKQLMRYVEQTLFKSPVWKSLDFCAFKLWFALITMEKLIIGASMIGVPQIIFSYINCWKWSTASLFLLMQRVIWSVAILVCLWAERRRILKNKVSNWICETITTKVLSNMKTFCYMQVTFPRQKMFSVLFLRPCTHLIHPMLFS